MPKWDTDRIWRWIKTWIMIRVRKIVLVIHYGNQRIAPCLSLVLELFVTNTESAMSMWSLKANNHLTSFNPHLSGLVRLNSFCVVLFGHWCSDSLETIILITKHYNILYSPWWKCLWLSCFHISIMAEHIFTVYYYL